MIRLINMPFGSLTRPALALSQFKAQLSDAGMPARVLYLNIDFARMIGFGSYEALSVQKGVDTQVSEWLFAGAAWRRPFGPDEQEFLRLCDAELGSIYKVPDPASWLLKIRREIIGRFLEQCYRRVIEGGVPRVVGFSCMFYQTIASLALGRLLKERHPEMKIVYGGACFHGEMGEELIRKVPWIDAVSTGEADDIVVDLFRLLADGKAPAGLHGILARDTGEAIVPGPVHRPVSGDVLDSLPDPDFDDFYEDAARSGLPNDPSWHDRLTLPLEASRGCWWGQKKHCTFCGLNADGMEFRLKSPEKIFATMKRLSARYRFRHLLMTDNILAMSYFKTLLPMMASERLMSGDRPVEVFFEVKANLTRAQTKAIADAGITSIQPGIESLSTHMLDLMAKGVAALQNAYLLKCCTQYGLAVYWNILIRIPGEAPEDYRQMVDWTRRMVHLRAPSSGALLVQCHRFSPYYFQKGRWTEDVRAAGWYSSLFPADQIDLEKVAYYFDATWKDTLDDTAYDELFDVSSKWMEAWRERAEVPRLTLHERSDGGLEIEDTRAGEPMVWQLGPREAAVYRAIDDIANPRKVRAELPAAIAEGMTEAAIRGQLHAFVEQGLALEEGDKFLGLALPPARGIEPIDRRRIRIRRLAKQHPRNAPPSSLRLPVAPRNPAS
jgi:ribosomal peptide maturation radical SAM protein 1